RDIPVEDLDPVYLSSSVHKRRKLIVGIPVAERKTDYLMETLTSLFQNLEDGYRSEILFIVMFATIEISSSSVRNKTAAMQNRFADEIRGGLLQ
ncbi:hypothetical protein GCK32_020722, partial [Trichostrongylus colubriformis]